MSHWPRLVALVCAIVPVVTIAAVIISTGLGAVAAVQRLGVARLFGPVLAAGAAKPEFGLLAPLFSTAVVSLLAIIVALPGALSLAIVAREFRVPYVSPSLATIVGLLAGIPPIIYAFGGIFFVEAFMRPKFTAEDVGDFSQRAGLQGLPILNLNIVPYGMPNSTLLGGILLGLLIVPFMTPLIDDSLRGVPAEFRAGSLALGATRWYTLARVVLPSALPGIVSAATLGTMVAFGEVLIPVFVIASAAGASLPKPIFDLFQQTPPVTSVGAALMGGFGAEDGAVPLTTSVGYFSAFALLVFALIFLAGEQLLQGYLRSRLQS